MTETEEERLREFRRIVNRCAREDLDWVISNRSPYRARYLIMKMFEVGQKWIDLYAGSLARSCVFEGEEVDIYAWPDLIAAARAFVSRQGTRLRILTQKPIDGGLVGNPFLAALTADGFGRCGAMEVVIPKSDVLARVDQHFVAVDRRAYRMETDHSKAVATASFNGPEHAKQLHALFENMVATLNQYGLAETVKLAAREAA